MSETKQCPYCGEEIKSVAIKCRHCGEFLNKPTESKKVVKKQIKKLYTLEQIESKLSNEKIDGIIPINPRRLKLAFANKTFIPTVKERIIVTLISVVALTIIPVLPLVLFMVGDLLGGSDTSLVLLMILLLGLIFRISDNIYIKRIKKYPEVFLVISESDLYCFVIEKQELDLFHKFDIDISKLNEIFFGEINKKTKQVKKHFEIKQKETLLMQGEINLKKGKLDSKSISSDLLLPVSKLQEIYLS